LFCSNLDSGSESGTTDVACRLGSFVQMSVGYFDILLSCLFGSFFPSLWNTAEGDCATHLTIRPNIGRTIYNVMLRRFLL
jgi:hypothetical protein